jgi:uncharacterized protein (TIGR02246 family)
MMNLTARLQLFRLSRSACRTALSAAIGCTVVLMAPLSSRAQTARASSDFRSGPDRAPAIRDSITVVDTAGIRSVVRAFADAWGRADATSIASLFTADGDLVIPTGLQVRGRADLRDFYASAFAKGYAGSTTTADVTRIRKIAPDVMVVDAAWSINGRTLTAGKSKQPERGILAAVIVRNTGRWWIAALREQEGASSLTTFDVRLGEVHGQ